MPAPSILSIGDRRLSDWELFSFNAPAGASAGDLLLSVFALTDNTEVATAPSGWSEVGAAYYAHGNIRLAAWAKVAGASEPGYYDWTATIARQVFGCTYRIAGHDGTLAAEADAGAHGGGSSPPILAPSVASSGADRLLVCFAYSADCPDSPVAPATLSHAYLHAGRFAAGARAIAAAGDTGAEDFGACGWGWTARTLLLAPGGGGPPSPVASLAGGLGVAGQVPAAYCF